MTINSVVTYGKVLAHGFTPFYAADLGVSGSSLHNLSRMGLVEKTGNTREVQIQIDDTLFRHVSANEWRMIPIENLEANYRYRWHSRELRKALEALVGIPADTFLTMLEALQKFC